MLHPDAPLVRPLTYQEAHDAQVRALLTHHELVARQIAELSLKSAAVDDRLANNAERIGKIEAELRINTEVTTEVRDILHTVKGGMRVLGHLGTGARWLGYLAAAATSVYVFAYALTHNGSLPGKQP